MIFRFPLSCFETSVFSLFLSPSFPPFESLPSPNHINHHRARSLPPKLDTHIHSRDPFRKLPLRPVLSTVSWQEHRLSLAIKRLSAPILLALSTVYDGISEKFHLLELIQSSHDTYRRESFHAPSSGLRSLSLSSALEGATSEPLDDPPTSLEVC